MINATAIIGTSPSLKGSGLGEYIDSFEYVIRFIYKGNWQKPEDWGAKTSYFCGSTRRALAHLNNFLPDCGYFIWHKYSGKIYRELQFIIKIFGGEDVTDLISMWQQRLPRSRDMSITNVLSTGTAGVCIAAAKIGLPIVLFGCDWMEAGGGRPEDYVGSWFWEDGEKPTPGGHRRHHDWAGECGLRDEMAKEYNVNIEFWGQNG